MDNYLNEQVQDAPEQIVRENVEPQAQVVEEAPSYLSDIEKREDQRNEWEHKYRVLKGKYDKEVKRVYRELDSLRRENAELKSKIETLTMMLQYSGKSDERSVVDDVDDDIKKIKEEYPEIYKAMMRLVEKKVDEIRSEVTAKASAVTEQQYLTLLTSLVPNWQEINRDPDFIDWLQEKDELSGYTRHELLMMAHEKRDAYRVAQFFRKFLAENGVSSGKVSISPQTRKVSAGGERVQKVYKESEIRKFYTDASLGKIPPDVVKKWEEEYTKAMIEGRVIFGK